MAALIAQATQMANELAASGQMATPGVATDPAAAQIAATFALPADTSDHLFRVEFDRDAYGPGDEVTGRVTANGDVKGRKVIAVLRNYSESNDYQNHVDADSQDLAAGEVAAGHELRFSLRVPQDAVPPIATMVGRAFWGFVVQVDQRMRRDHQEFHAFPLVVPATDPGRSYAGDGGPAEIRTRVRGFDGQIAVDRSLVPLAGSLAATATVGKPAAGRALKVGLVAEVTYDYKSEHTESDGTGTTTSRSTTTQELWADWRPIDGSVATHQLTFQVPDGAPPTFTGKAFSVSWQVRFTEDRSLRRDPHVDAVLRVVR